MVFLHEDNKRQERESVHCEQLASDLKQTRLRRDSEGLEVAPIEYHGITAPQSIPGPEKEALTINADNDESDKIAILKSSPKTHKSWQKRRIWLSVLIVALAILIIGIAVPLSVHHSKSKSNSVGQSTQPVVNASLQYFSNTGAFNGTRLATLNMDDKNISVTHIFYQDYLGQLRRAQRTGSTQSLWYAGSNIRPIVGENARNATPLACVNYTNITTGIETAHLFYVDSSNMLQDVISVDNLTTWSPGRLGPSNITTPASTIAISAIYSDGVVLRLYYGSNDNTMNELTFGLGGRFWESQFEFNNTNGNAGISAAIASEEPGTARLYSLDFQNNLQMWFLNASAVAYTTSGLGLWTLNPANASVELAVNSSLAWAQYWLIFQLPNGTISIFNPPAFLEQLWFGYVPVANYNSNIAQRGSSIIAGSLYEPKADVDIFYQPNGTNIMESTDTTYQVGGFDFSNALLPV